MNHSASASSKLSWAFAGCGAVWGILQTYMVHSFGFSWYISVVDGLVSTVLLSFACWLINNNLRYYQPGKGSYVNLLIWCLALAGFSMAGSRWFLPFVDSDAGYNNFLSQSVVIRFFINFLAVGWMAMISMVWYGQVDQKENEKRKSEAEGLVKIIPVHDVLYLEADDDYVSIHTAEGSYLKNKTMSFFEQTLDARHFVRVHRSYMVSIQEITRIDPYEKDAHLAILKSGAKIPVSKSGYAKLKQVLGI